MEVIQTAFQAMLGEELLTVNTELQGIRYTFSNSHTSDQHEGSGALLVYML